VVTLIGPDAAARASRLATEIDALGTVARPAGSADLERLVAEVQTPHGPLARFVFMQTRVSEATDRAEVQVSYRCWPENRYVEVREDIHRLARRAGGASAAFPNDPFPAMVTPPADGQTLRRYLDRTVGQDRTRLMHAAIPFSGEDFALFLNRLPGTYTFLGVRTPGAAVETSYPHFSAFNPDERAIGHGVRAMAGWLAERARA
jgi:metal-dependent amidase/aminoacylase/carboxypeptidase family protein